MRVFVAIEISDDKIVDSIKKFQSEINIDAKAVESGNFHFTLQFLGEISEGASPKIIEALHTVEFSGFDVSLKGVGVFPESGSPKIIWIGTDEDSRQKLVELAKKVEKTLLSLGFLPDKTFKPHITVFRIKKKAEDITKELSGKKTTYFGTQNITEIKLKKSEFTPNGPVYSDLGEIKAGK